jgi:hypothetical protein
MIAMPKNEKEFVDEGYVGLVRIPIEGGAMQRDHQDHWAIHSH